MEAGGPSHPDTRRWPSLLSSLCSLGRVATFSSLCSTSSSASLSYCAIRSMEEEEGGETEKCCSFFHSIFSSEVQKTSPTLASKRVPSRE